MWNDDLKIVTVNSGNVAYANPYTFTLSEINDLNDYFYKVERAYIRYQAPINSITNFTRMSKVSLFFRYWNKVYDFCMVTADGSYFGLPIVTAGTGNTPDILVYSEIDMYWNGTDVAGFEPSTINLRLDIHLRRYNPSEDIGNLSGQEDNFEEVARKLQARYPALKTMGKEYKQDFD